MISSQLNLEATLGELLSQMHLKDLVALVEKEAIARAFRINNGCVSRTAKALGIKRTTLYMKMKRRGLRA